MKTTNLLPLLCIFLLVASCKKDDNAEETNPVSVSEVLSDFANVVAYPNYQEIELQAALLKDAIQLLNTTTNDANLSAARNAWRATRQPWEQCESFIFGPVEDFNYDPTMDTWPVNRVDMDSLLASTNTLTVSEIDALPESLKGFHPIEYLLFGSGGSKTAADFTSREKQYLISLAEHLYYTTSQLRNSWDSGLQGNFTTQLVTAGSGSTRFATRKDALLAIAGAMAGICDEVANGKMEDPLAAQDSTLEESQFAHNSTADFKNNMIGVLNVYLGKFSNDGKGLNDLVAFKSLSLDNTLQSQINAAINSFNSIDANYGAAIYTQHVQIHNAQNALNTLKATIENDLVNFIHTYIKD